ncbi:MAG TPA: polyprenyl synthetase family protein [Actinomycetes bacterium]|nr:polyprenyl synthetase family protein [Actinomycetes bacterium]
MTHAPETTVPAPTPLDREGLRGRIDAALGDLLDRGLDGLGFLDEELEPVAAALRAFVLAGGKRLRPAFVYWGYRGAGGSPGAEAAPVVRAACAVEFLHVCALVHDDIMDGSPVRRGRPSVHVEFADLHRRAGWRGDARAFGESAAILMGDIAFTFADIALATAGLPPGRQAAAFEVFNVLRSELMGGQYLDVVAAQRGGVDERAVERVLRYKSGKYTIERPLHMGAAMADAPPPALAGVYSAYGLPLGEAFQLRDDVLGVFGAPAVTGKPAGDDLREGKETWLVVRARKLAGPAGRRLLEAGLGDAGLSEEGVGRLRAVIVESGALADAEARIAALARQATGALEHPAVEPAARDTLLQLAAHVTDRSA